MLQLLFSFANNEDRLKHQQDYRESSRVFKFAQNLVVAMPTTRKNWPKKQKSLKKTNLMRSTGSFKHVKGKEVQ